MRSRLRWGYFLLAIVIGYSFISTYDFNSELKKQDEQALDERVSQILESVEDKISSETTLIELDQQSFESQWPSIDLSESQTIRDATYIDSLSVTVKISEGEFDQFLAAEQAVNPGFEIKFPSSNQQRYIVLRNSDPFYVDLVGADLSTFGTSRNLESSPIGSSLTKGDDRGISPFTEDQLLEIRVRGTTLGADGVGYESWTSGQLNLVQILEDVALEFGTDLGFVATTGVADEVIFSNNDSGRTFVSSQQASTAYGSFSVDFEFFATPEFYGQPTTPNSLVVGWIFALVLALACLFELARSSFDEKSRLSREQALTDELTGLPNRRWLEEFSATTETDDGAELAVLFLDLDRFKEINDIHGHEVGDVVLIEIANRLRLLDHETLLPVRLAGDEFLLVGTISAENSRTVLETVAQTVLRHLNEPLNLDGFVLTPSASVGIASSDLKHEPVKEVLRRADNALYRAKDMGELNFFFDQSLEQELPERKVPHNILELRGIQFDFRALRTHEGIISGVQARTFDKDSKKFLNFKDLRGDSQLFTAIYSELVEQANQLASNSQSVRATIWVEVAGSKVDSQVECLAHAVGKLGVPMSRIVLVTDLETYSQDGFARLCGRYGIYNVCLINPFGDLSKLDSLSDKVVKFVLLDKSFGVAGDGLVRRSITKLSEDYNLTFVSNLSAGIIPMSLEKSLYRDNHPLETKALASTTPQAFVEL